MRKNVARASLSLALAPALGPGPEIAPLLAITPPPGRAQDRRDRMVTRKTAQVQTGRLVVVTRATLVVSFIDLFVYSFNKFVTSTIVTILFLVLILSIHINIQSKLVFTTFSSTLYS